MPKYYKTKRPILFKIGDRVRLRKDVLVRHARSVPAHMGYTREGFQWRATLHKYRNFVGTITRVFDSGSVNVTFSDKNVIGIDQAELVKQ